MSKGYYFLGGFILNWSYRNWMQDMMGKEKFLKLADVMWVEMSPLWWAVPIILWALYGILVVYLESYYER